jgi:hypothetical protein
MRNTSGFWVIAAIAGAVPLLSSGEEAERQMNVQQGPDSVFAEAPSQIFPQLAGATATDENGRIGNELVFWGYRLADGREVYLVACAMVESIDCAARESRVCLTEAQVISRGTSQGLVREINCRSIATVAPGDIRPGCTDKEQSQELAVSLVTCI